MSLKSFIQNPYCIAIGGTVIANYISAKANNLSLNEMVTHQISVYSWLFISILGVASLFLLMLIRKQYGYESVKRQHKHQLEVQDYDFKQERSAFFNRQHQSNELITGLNEQIGQKQPLNTPEEIKKQNELNEFNEMKATKAWNYMEIIRRAKDSDNCSAYNPTYVEYFLGHGLITPNYKTIMPGYYNITDKGLRFLGMWAEEQVRGNEN